MSADIQGVLTSVEAFDASQASTARLLSDSEGFRQIKVRESEAYKRKLRDFVTWYGQVLEGGVSRGRVQDVMSGERQVSEALTRSDLPLYFGDTLQRLMLADFAMRPAEWQRYVRIDDTIPDFRNVSRHAIDGVDAPLDQVDAQGEYGEAQVSETRVQYRVFKRGRIVPVEWEALINDDLGALRRMPQRLSRAVARTETKHVADLIADASGPHASLYSAGNSNIVTSNPVLSIAALQTAKTIMDTQTDSSGEPIGPSGIILVIPPALEVIAENLRNMLQVRLTAGAGGSATNQEVLVNNWLIERLTIVVNEYLPVVSTTNGATSWYVFADPSAGRPAVEVGFLRGFRNPQLLMKASNQVPVGGGTELDPFAGDFETDTARWKVRHIIGGARVEHRMTVASNGTGV